MADGGRFLGVDHGASRSAADVASPPRSAAGSAAPLSAKQIEIGRRGFATGIATAIDLMEIAAKVYRDNGQSASAGALETLIPMLGERQLDTELLAALAGPRR